jgi:hypothetical protein
MMFVVTRVRGALLKPNPDDGEGFPSVGPHESPNKAREHT